MTLDLRIYVALCNFSSQITSRRVEGGDEDASYIESRKIEFLQDFGGLLNALFYSYRNGGPRNKMICQRRQFSLRTFNWERWSFVQTKKFQVSINHPM